METYTEYIWRVEFTYFNGTEPQSNNRVNVSCKYDDETNARNYIETALKKHFGDKVLIDSMYLSPDSLVRYS